jgi:hypothetical protein
MFDFTDMKQQLDTAFDGAFRLFAGAAFVVLAIASIQYDEHIAPSVERVSDGWSMAATDIGRRLTSFTL